MVILDILDPWMKPKEVEGFVAVVSSEKEKRVLVVGTQRDEVRERRTDVGENL